MKLDALTRSLDEMLAVSEIKDYPNAVNGLQVENSGEVTRVAVAVDACEPVIRTAVKKGADLLIVHHGLFWSGLQPVIGPLGRKIRLCMENNLAVYSVHLPLDAHSDLGNNARLCSAIGLPGYRTPFLDIGLQIEADISRDELVGRVETAVGRSVHLAPGGPERVRKVGIVTGGAGGEVFQAAAAGVDTFITGEGPHWSYTAAEEAGINLIYAGHYATETFGVKALGEYLEAEHGLPWEFLDHPTGL